jgi:choline dehydrogenase
MASCYGVPNPLEERLHFAYVSTGPRRYSPSLSRLWRRMRNDMGQPDGFDIAIVGAGAAGCVIARRLSEPGDRAVLLLEAGPDLRSATPVEFHDGWRLPTAPDWGFQSEPDALGATGTSRRGRVLGGTSWLTRFAVRGAAADFDAWAANGNSGWSFEDVLPAFRRLEADAEFGDRPWHGDHGPIPITRYLDDEPSEIHGAALRAFDALGYPAVEDHNEPQAMGVGRMPMSSRSGQRVTALDGYLPPDWRSPRLTVRPGAEVARLLMDGGRATGVRLLDGTEIRADAVVLAAGTYGSPTILMRSGIGPADHLRSVGIDVLVDLPGVGANLADHPGVDLDSGWRGVGVDGPILHSIATFRTSAAPTASGQDLMFWVTDPVGDEPRFAFDPVLLTPRSRGSVRLRSADPTQPPRIALPGLRESVDVDRLVEGYRRGLELANQSEFRRLCTEPAPPDPGSRAALRRVILQNAYSIPHVVGTCAMGPSPGNGAVVDAHGRVHGVAGLAVVDASIVPEAPSGFPHIITMMIAEHLSQTLGALS